MERNDNRRRWTAIGGIKFTYQMIESIEIKFIYGFWKTHAQMENIILLQKRRREKCTQNWLNKIQLEPSVCIVFVYFKALKQLKALQTSNELSNEAKCQTFSVSHQLTLNLRCGDTRSTSRIQNNSCVYIRIKSNKNGKREKTSQRFVEL